MICLCGSYVSGDWCRVCERIIIERKSPVKEIKKRSEKGLKEDLIYKAKRIKFLRDNQRCAVFNELKSVEVHHACGRLGKNYLDVSTWFAVSRKGHDWIHSNDSEAREKGFLLTRTA